MLPIGFAIKVNGLLVLIVPNLWWSTISTSSAVSTPSIACAGSLWSIIISFACFLFKIFEEYGVRFGISQAETVTLTQLPEVINGLKEELLSVKESNKLDWMMLLVTDIIKEESQLITTGFAPAEQIFAYKKLEDNLFHLPGVLSRKKQLLPEISRILEEISK